MSNNIYQQSWEDLEKRLRLKTPEYVQQCLQISYFLDSHGSFSVRSRNDPAPRFSVNSRQRDLLKSIQEYQDFLGIGRIISVKTTLKWHVEDKESLIMLVAFLEKFPLSSSIQQERFKVWKAMVEIYRTGTNKSPKLKTLYAILCASKKKERSALKVGACIIHPDQIQELKTIKSPVFDLRRLVKLCEELNDCYVRGNFHAVAMLTRAILDHVPPIFGQEAFIQVASNYGGNSFKDIAQHLQNTSRKISDHYLHQPIRKHETLPSQQEVDFSQALTFLIGEILRISKEWPIK